PRITGDENKLTALPNKNILGIDNYPE
ncbi:hypothetical protein W657_02574, partial [Staphylococcus aureus VET0436R]